MRTLETQDDVADGFRELSARCEVMQRMGALTGVPPLRRSEPGFPGLVRTVIGQQVSVASANAIWGRVSAAFGELTPFAIRVVDDGVLKGCGLSAPKLRTLRGIAAAVERGELPLDALPALPPDQARVVLTGVKGIGPWTADIYLMFALGQADAFAAGDLALQEAIRVAFRLPERPSERETLMIAERWRPWRAVAAATLWAYYRIAKEREGVIGTSATAGSVSVAAAGTPPAARTGSRTTRAR